MKRLALSLLVVFVLGGCSTMPVKPQQDILHDICWANNLFRIYEHDQLAFTFNAQLPDKVVQRQWVWHIKTNQVFLNGSEQPISQAFINDIYWLLFPLKAYESRDQVAVTVSKTSRRRCRKRTVRRLSYVMSAAKDIRPTTPTSCMSTTI